MMIRAYSLGVIREMFSLTIRPSDELMSSMNFDHWRNLVLPSQNSEVNSAINTRPRKSNVVTYI